MKTFLIASLIASLGATSALAADLPTRKAAPYMAPVDAAFNWTGLYLGVNGGYGWGGSGLNGGLAGGTLGYNYQMGQMVIGAEADLDFAPLRGNQTYPLNVNLRTRMDSLTTERLRLGYASDRTLFFVTGGYAGGNVRATLWDVPNGLSASRSQWRNGFAVGGGVEYAFTNHISAKAEYLYTGLGSQSINDGFNSGRSSANESLFRVGLNYRF